LALLTGKMELQDCDMVSCIALLSVVFWWH